MKKKQMIVSMCSLFILLSTLVVTNSYATQITSSTYAYKALTSSPDLVDQSSVTNGQTWSASSNSKVRYDYIPPTHPAPGAVYGMETSEAAAYGNTRGEISVSSEHSLHVGTVDFPGPTDGTARAEVRWEQTYYIPSGSNTAWNFSISSGALSTGFHGEGNGYSEAGYAIDISVNGTSAWSSRATLSGYYDYANGNLPSWVFDDTLDQLSLYDSVDDMSAFRGYTGPQDFSINLSQYITSGYADVVYSMSVWATDMPYGSHITGFGSEFINLSSASFGDPINTDGGVFINDSDLTRVESAPDPVPEPATILLLGSGLAGLAFYRRKRK